MLATDTPDMAARGDVGSGGGPAMSLYSFHGRGTLTAPSRIRRLSSCSSETAAQEKIPLQRSAHIGALTDSSYVQFVNAGVASIDLGFPARYTHSSLEVCDLADLERLARLVGRRPSGGSTAGSASIATISRNEALSRRRYRHLRIEGRAGRRHGPHRRLRRQAAQDDRARAGLGRASPARRLVGRFHFHQSQAPRRQPCRPPSPSAPWQRAPSGLACCRSMPTASR